MKMSKKKLLSLALVLVLIATLSFGSLAWFSDSESVENKFYVASSEDEDPDDIFSLDVYEDVDTNDDGNLERVDEGGAEFKNILPGEFIEKVPYVENTGRYDQWVRLTITFSKKDAWYALCNLGGDPQYAESPLALLTFCADFNANWVGGSYTELEDGYEYVYYSKNVVTPDTVLGTFTGVNIPYQLTQQEMANIYNLTLSVKADAVQTENLGEGVDTAKEAFAVVEQTQEIG